VILVKPVPVLVKPVPVLFRPVSVSWRMAPTKLSSLLEKPKEKGILMGYQKIRGFHTEHGVVGGLHQCIRIKRYHTSHWLGYR
jgi:hypothetical protein